MKQVTFLELNGDFTAPQGCEIICSDAKTALSAVPDKKFRCCVTSPPYWGLRDYGTEHQIGAEPNLKDYINNLRGVFAEVHRTLTDDGTLWLNIGDSYTSGGRTWRDGDKKNKGRAMDYRAPTPEGLKPKDLIGVPWRLAFALQEEGWYLRSDIIWHKPNCQPESVKTGRHAPMNTYSCSQSQSTTSMTARLSVSHQAPGTKKPPVGLVNQYGGIARSALRDISDKAC